MVSYFYAPELFIVYLVAFDAKNVLEEYDFNVVKFVESLDRGRIVDAYVPDVFLNQRFIDLTDDLKIFYGADNEFFDVEYLGMRRFSRINLKDKFVVVKTKNGGVFECLLKPFLTIYNTGIGIYKLLVMSGSGGVEESGFKSGLKNVSKNDIIDFCFPDYLEMEINGREITMSNFIVGEVKKFFSNRVLLSESDLDENMLTMIFIKDFPFNSDNLPDDFIEKFRGDIFDVLTLPRRYYENGVYDYHATRTSSYIKEVLTNISVRNDFPVFVSNNRFLGIKIMTKKPDYNFHKRIVFNIILYSNTLLQLKLLKEINLRLSEIIKHPKNLSLGRLVTMREEIFRDLEEYINTRIQRYEIWRRAMLDAAKEIGIPQLYRATIERLEMLNNYIQASYQKSSNILFIILNSLIVVSATQSIITLLLPNINPLTVLLIISIMLIFWLILLNKLFARYIK